MDAKRKRKRPSAKPIINPKDIRLIRANLQNKPRNLLLFDLAMETGLGITKLLPLRTKDLQHLNVGDKIPIEASKHGNYSVTITETVYKTFQEYLSKTDPEPDDYLFKSKKGQRPINLSSASNMIKGWFKEVNKDIKYSALSIKKTWLYNQMNRAPKGHDNKPTFPSRIFRPIETSTAQEIVYRKLTEAIITGKIPPGTRLTTAEISNAFKVSQAPARVALNWLEAKGFIISKKKKASIVKELTIKELKEIMHIRLILETASVELAINVSSNKTLNLAESINKKGEKSQNLEERDKMNTLFHLTLYRDIHMPLLMQMISDLCNKVSPYIILFFSTKNSRYEEEMTYEFSHRGMVEGMRSRDVKKVLRHLEKDLQKATATLEKILKKREKYLSEMTTNQIPASYNI